MLFLFFGQAVPLGTPGIMECWAKAVRHPQIYFFVVDTRQTKRMSVAFITHYFIAPVFHILSILQHPDVHGRANGL